MPEGKRGEARSAERDGDDYNGRSIKNGSARARKGGQGGGASDGYSSSSSSSEEEQMQFKVILLGDGAVGKTSVASQFANGVFAKSYKQTVGLDFFVKHLALPENTNVTLQLWDIGGQSIGSKMLKNYIFGAHAVVLCYDITNYTSFQNLEDWLRLVNDTFSEKMKRPYTALLANKMDLNHVRAVSKSLHEAFVETNQVHSCFVSAKTGDSVDSSFFQIAADLAGVVLTTPAIHVTQKVVTAEIVNHQRDDPNVSVRPISERKGKCTVQ